MLKHISPSRGPRRNKDTGDTGKSTWKIIIKLKIDKVLAILSQMDTYHHRLKENPSPTPLVHHPPTQKIGWNLKAQVWICWNPRINANLNGRADEEAQVWAHIEVCRVIAQSVIYLEKASRKWKWKIFAEYYTLQQEMENEIHVIGIGRMVI